MGETPEVYSLTAQVSLAMCGNGGVFCSAGRIVEICETEFTPFQRLVLDLLDVRKSAFAG